MIKQKRLMVTMTLILSALIWQPVITAADEKETLFTVAPFIEYQYLTDTGGGEEIFDEVNDVLGGWLRGYEDLELFQQLLLIGVEFRAARPQQWGGWEPFVSLGGSTGSPGTLGGDDYDQSYDQDDIAVFPEYMDAWDIPFVDISGQMRLRVDQYLDYYVPLQVGVRYETRSENPLSFFGAVSGGPLFYKGGLDIDVDLDGSVTTPLVNGQAEASYHGKAELEDTGWLMSLMAGMRYRWKPGLASSLALGYGTGRVEDDVHIRGSLNGNALVTTLMAENAIPFSADLMTIDSVSARLDGWRVRLGIVEWTW
ncbi:MAG: hypothetical protein AB1724_19130 [Thermodesulfobacteriota bacterium]